MTNKSGWHKTSRASSSLVSDCISSGFLSLSTFQYCAFSTFHHEAKTYSFYNYSKNLYIFQRKFSHSCLYPCSSFQSLFLSTLSLPVGPRHSVMLEVVSRMAQDQFWLSGADFGDASWSKCYLLAFIKNKSKYHIKIPQGWWELRERGFVLTSVVQVISLNLESLSLSQMTEKVGWGRGELS